ncbi:peptide ABC transporter ATP-binding protein [Sporosarcina sp. P12(2017)]|uniref:ATP-binding cassette domain-containing protein n=1 Tax=unclassified Sporosarcina TaxID=2647733 RepID=UPI000C1732FE|nr:MULTISPECIES: ABC transporter ATP-binding protein [unclassified Sporosarcina]PIC58032.1 peptide ABC transporter ATP-binding protein [Sporosarcina sp. P10]PIC59433.1 peptide ABC transporter ATP-binding protein [Sporosarcina sp. P12(2017)]
MIDVRDLTINIKGKHITQHVNFTIPRGRITSLIGESGSGKSMTVSALLGMLPVDAKVSGYVMYEGRNVLDASDQEMESVRKQDIFTIFQDASNSFNPSVKMGRQLYAFSGERIGDTVDVFNEKMKLILDQLGLSWDVVEQYPVQLSGGMLQRCMIACAFYVEPALLIADEPTSALDMVLQKEFIQLLIRLNEERNTTILLITHDLDIVAEAAHEMAVMQQGTIVETGTVETVFSNPHHAYTKRLLKSRF